MENYPIKTSQVAPSGYIIHEMEDGSRLKYSNICMGLVWPTARSPAYFCVMAEDYLDIYDDPENPKKWGKLHLIAEKEFNGLSIDKLCFAIYDVVDLYRIWEVYCDEDEEWAEYYDTLRDYGYSRGLTKVRYTDAPFKANFIAGLALVNDWGAKGLLDLPAGSVAYEQMKDTTKQDLGRPEAQFDFYAANALRYAVSGVYRFRPRCYRKKPKYRNRNRRGMVL